MYHLQEAHLMDVGTHRTHLGGIVKANMNNRTVGILEVDTRSRKLTDPLIIIIKTIVIRTSYTLCITDVAQSQLRTQEDREAPSWGIVMAQDRILTSLIFETFWKMCRDTSRSCLLPKISVTQNVLEERRRYALVSF